MIRHVTEELFSQARKTLDEEYARRREQNEKIENQTEKLFATLNVVGVQRRVDIRTLVAEDIVPYCIYGINDDEECFYVEVGLYDRQLTSFAVVGGIMTMDICRISRASENLKEVPPSFEDLAGLFKGQAKGYCFLHSANPKHVYTF